VPDIEQVIGVHEPGRKHERFLDWRIDAIPERHAPHRCPLDSMSNTGFSLGGVGYVLVDRAKEECLKFL